MAPQFAPVAVGIVSPKLEVLLNCTDEPGQIVVADVVNDASGPWPIDIKPAADG